MSKMITYYGNCWMTNLGEAFIDIGAMELLKQALPDYRTILLTPMSKYYNNQLRLRSNNIFETEEKSMNNAAHLGMFIKSDFFVMSGMFATEEFLTHGSERYWVRDFLRKNSEIKVLLMGVGASEYNERESSIFLKYITDEIDCCGFISRDNDTYGMYNGLINNCFMGIDCAFFVDDSYDPRGFSDKKYIISTFDHIKEPDLINQLGCEIIRPNHMFYNAKYDKSIKNIFISDTPHDYLSLYANAAEVHTDLVHATIVSLSYGVKVKYYGNSRRAATFDAVGAIRDNDGFLSLDRNLLTNNKQKMIQNVKRLLSGRDS